MQGLLEELASRLAGLEPWAAAVLPGLLVVCFTSLGGPGGGPWPPRSGVV